LWLKHETQQCLNQSVSANLLLINVGCFDRYCGGCLCAGHLADLARARRRQWISVGSDGRNGSVSE